NNVLERGYSLDDFGNALQGHQDEADRQYQLDRPADEPPGIRGNLVDFPGVHEPGPGEIDENGAHRQKEQEAADNIDPDARALRGHAIEEVDADVLVHLQGLGAAEQHHGGKHVPLDFQPAVRADAEEVAAEGVPRADEAGKQHEPVGDHAELR